MIDPLLAAADAWPDVIALVDATRRWTWRELLADANDLAIRLDLHGHDRVALLSLDTGAAVAAIHAVRLSGATLVPLSRRSTVAELVPSMLRTGTTRLIHDPRHAPVAAELAAAVPGLTRIPLDAAAGGAVRGTRMSEGLDLDSLGALMFTSGTTGAPRAVRLTHASLLASARSWNTSLGAHPGDHWLAALPLSHVAGLGVVLRSVLAGARITIHDGFDPSAVRAAMAEDGISHVSLVPTQLLRCLDDGPIVAPRLRALLLGGAPIPAALIQRAVAAGLPVVTTYGMTEAASGVTALPATEAAAFPDSSGRALPGMRVRVMLDDGTPAPVGIRGDIDVSGPNLFAGYDDDAAATNAVMRDGWLRTGDLGSLDGAGRLTITGRRDELIISGGENISPAEVESVLLTHPAIADAAVVGRTHPEWGAVPVAAVVLRVGVTDLDATAFRAFCRQRMASFKVPQDITAVNAIPRTASGKIIRRDVARLLDAVAHDLFVTRPDGARIHVQRRGDGPTLLLLHATLSNARELEPLAIDLAAAFTVLAIDRRSAGASVMPPDDVLGPIEVQTHINDMLAVLDALRPGGPVLVVGHSYGACVGLEFAARQPGLVAGAFLFEPPYLGVLPDTAAESVALGRRITETAQRDGLGAAALAFLETVNGAGITRRLPADVLAQFEREGRGAVADAALAGFEPAGLGGVRVPVHLGLGGRSRGPYAAVAAALGEHVPRLQIHQFPTLGHGGPVSQPGVVAPIILGCLGSADPDASPALVPGGSS